MNIKQKFLVTGWALIISLFILISIYDEWIGDNWDTIKWPSFIVILIFIAFSPKSKKDLTSEGRANINDIVNKNPWIKIYMVIYCIVISIVCFDTISSKTNLVETIGFLELAIPILGILLPVMIVHQIKIYTDAGK